MKNPIKKIVKIGEYAKKNEFGKVLDVLNALEAEKLSPKNENDLVVAKEKVFNVLRFEFKRAIGTNKLIEKQKIDILMKMSDDNIEQARLFIKNATLKRFVLEFQSKNMEVKSLANIKQIFENLIELFEKVKFFYNRFPKEWNFEGEFFFYSVLHIKEILFEIYISPWTREQYLTALRTIIDFERKYTKFFFKKGCCLKKEEILDSPGSRSDASGLKDKETDTSKENKRISTQIIKYNEKCSHISKNIIIFDKDQILTKNKNIKTNFIVLYHRNNKSLSDFCKHRKMLSFLLLPDIDIYIENIFEPIKSIKICLKTKEMHLIKSFVDFFSVIGTILAQIQHFEEPRVYELFLKSFDTYLIDFLNFVKIPSKYKDLIILLNTLNFIEHTTIDLLEKTAKYILFKSSGKNLIRQLEKKTCFNIEKCLKLIFRRTVKEKILFSTELIKILTKEVFILNNIEIDESIFIFVTESLLSFQFNRIINLPMNSKQAETLIMEVIEVKIFVKKHLKNVPLADLMVNYLKIFICNIDDPTNFVTCFNHLNQNIFSFQNILDALEDKSKNDQLLIEYKKQQNTVDKYPMDQPKEF